MIKIEDKKPQTTNYKPSKAWFIVKVIFML